MARVVSTCSNSYATALQWSARPGYQVVAPSRLAARALQVQHRPLRQLAIQALAFKGQKIAPDLAAQRLFRQVVQDIAQPGDLLGTAKAWLPATRSLLQSSPNLAAVTALSEPITKLLDSARAYQTTLSQQGLIDGADLYWQAASSQVLPQQLLIYGYFQPRADELAWINTVAAEASVLFLPTANSPLFAETRAAVDWLTKQGWQVVENLDPAPYRGSEGKGKNKGEGEGIIRQSGQTAGDFSLGVSLSQAFCAVSGQSSSNPLGQARPGRAQTPPLAATAHAYSSLESEVRGTLAQVKALLNGGTLARDIAIVARDEAAYGPKLIDIAWEYGVPLRALYQTPLLSTRLGSWLALLIDVIDAKFPFESTARLLSHTLASNPDRDFWATARCQRPQGFAAWKSLAQAHLDLDLDLLAQINQARRRDTWVALWQQILRQFDLRRRCARWARESLAFNTCRSALGALAEPEAELLSWGDFRRELRDLLERLSIPAQPGRGGVELHTPRSVIGARYSHLFVIGMAEGVLPALIDNDPLLDFFERQQLRQQGVMLPSAAEMARREALNVYFLLQTVTTAGIFSYPQLKGRKELLPSPYLAQLGLIATEPPAAAIASPEEYRRTLLRHSSQSEDPVLLAAARAYAVEQSRESSAAANEYDGIVGMPFDYANWSFSVSQLQNLGQCPFKWFAGKLLKLGPPEEPDEDLSPSQIGRFYHRVLELVLAGWREDPALQVADPALLHRAFALAERELLPPTLRAWTLRREEHLGVLTLTLRDPSFLPPGATPVWLESDFVGQWHGLKVKGRIDRIDRTDAGLVLIDYKTGKSRPTGIKDQTGKACIDLQLPLYQQAAGPAQFPGETIAAAYYYSIRSRKKILLPSSAPHPELPAAIERCKAHLEAGHYPVQPDSDRKACTYCNFDVLCRQGDRLSHKEMTHGPD